MCFESFRLFVKPLKLLKIVGPWKLILTFSMMFFMQIRCMFSAKDLGNVVEAVAVLTVMTGAFSKSLNFLAKLQKVEECLNEFENLVNLDNWIEAGKDSKLMTRVIFAYKTLKALLSIAALNFLASFLKPIFLHELPLNFCFPFDYNKNEFLFWLAVAIESIPCTFLGVIVVVVETFPVLVLLYLIGITEELTEKIDKLGNDEASAELEGTSEHDKILKDLLKCIEIHIKIRELARLVSNVFGKIIWMEGLLSVIILCNVSFAIKNVRNLDEFCCTFQALRL